MIAAKIGTRRPPLRAGLALLAAALAGVVARAPASGRGEIAFIGVGGELHTIESDGRNDRALGRTEGLHSVAWRADPASLEDVTFAWPTWSPDGRKLLALGRSGTDEETNEKMYVVEAETGRVASVLDHPGMRPLYAFWSPDGTRAAILGNHGRGLRLALWPSIGPGETDVVADGGMPFFWDWGRDSRSLALHTGDDPDSTTARSVSLVRLGRRERDVISLAPAEFGAPSWSSHGDWLAYAEAMGGHKARLVVSRGDGKDPVALLETPNRLAMSWSPTTSFLAVAKGKDVGEAHLAEILLFDLGKVGGPSRSAAPDFSIVREAFVAFFWAPTGDRLLLAETSESSPFWSWRTIDVETGEAHDVGQFLPSHGSLNLFRYFDQYALSHRLWAPDGKHFVFSGLAGAELGTAGPESLPHVYVADASGASPLRAIAEGDSAYWAPR